MTTVKTNTINSIFQGRSFLAEKDFSPAELAYLIDFGLHLKYLKRHNIAHQYLAGQNIALLFEKPSTRTRAAFTTAAVELGAHPEYLGVNDIQLGSKESIEDTAIVLGRMFDGIEFRGFNQQTAHELAKYSGVPVWNGLTDAWHPTQMLADFMTIKENFGHLRGLTLAFIGDGRNNIAQSLLITGSMLGVAVHIIAPKELQPPAEIIHLAYKLAQVSNVQPVVTDNIAVGIKNANIIYTDVWVSMGETDWQTRVALLKPYQVNMDLYYLSDQERYQYFRIDDQATCDDIKEVPIEEYSGTHRLELSTHEITLVFKQAVAQDVLPTLLTNFEKQKLMANEVIAYTLPHEELITELPVIVKALGINHQVIQCMFKELPEVLTVEVN